MRGLVLAAAAAAAAWTACGCTRWGLPGISQGLQSEDPSERIQAAIKAAESKERSVVPLLVERLDDPEPDVRFFAVEALKKITGQALGYEYYADAQKRFAAMTRWRQWLASSGTTKPSPASRPGGGEGG